MLCPLLSMDQSRLLKEFTSKTGAEHGVAKKLLQENNWNVEKASRAYGVIQTATLPPVGPRKNATSNQQLPPVAAVRNTLSAGDAVVLRSSSPTNNAETRKLKRGLSKSTDNVIIVNKARESVLNDIVDTSEDEQHFVDTPEYTFILPDLTKFLEDFRAFLQKDLIETATLVSLEQAGRLNWWADIGACSRLLPLATTGDGNCLLHAASLGMWGFHDRQLTLRQALFKTLSADSIKSAFWRRWRWHQTQINKQSGLILSEKEWQEDWTGLLKLASTVPRTHPGSQLSCCDSPSTKGLMERKEKDTPEESEVFYESLEEFHVFVLAHVLRRPIIVVADTVLKNCSGEALAPIPFGGIYLPLESKPENCHRSPLLLTYDAAHFSALVPMDTKEEENGTLTAAIPLVDPELNLLPIHFLVDPGPQFVWNKDELDPAKVKELEPDTKERLEFVQQYIDLLKVPIPQSPYPDNDSRPRSSSWSGPKEALNRSMSIESSESNHSGTNGHNNVINNVSSLGNSNGSDSLSDLKNNGDKKKDKDKNKGSKQMHIVVKSFGSIGKTMSKKLKNLGGLKSVKLENAKSDKVRVPSVGSVTQSTNMTMLTTDLLKDKDHVLCSKLLHKRLDYQEQMVQNYLKAARENFEQDRELRKQQDEEMKRITERRRIEQETPAPCINTGCKQQGTPAMSYLCKDCYDKQRKEALDMESKPDRSEVDGNMLVVKHNSDKKSVSPELQRQNTVVNLGSSKFYTYVEEDQCLSPPKYDNVSNNVLQQAPNLNNASITRDKVRKAPLELSRSSFYDESLSDQPKSLVKSNSPGTARIINNLQDEDFNSCTLDMGDRPSGQHLSTYNERPKPIVETRQNLVNINTLDYQNRTNIYAPKVQNVAQTHQKEMPQYQTSKTVANGSNTGKQYVVNSSNVSGQYVSRIEVGNSPSVEYPPRQKCRNDSCQGLGSDDKEYYCSKCFSVYERNKTTFL